VSHHPTERSRDKILKSHLFLGAALLVGALALTFWPATRPVRGSVAAMSVVIHTGAVVAIHLGIALAGAGILITGLWFHARGRGDKRSAPGATIRWPRLHDWLVTAYFFGREARVRERTLDIVHVAAGERVLDVGCGTGTLALAAKERVGAGGSVHGVDAAVEMIARARTRSARSGVPVAFEIAAAQSLPFADAVFDVALCSLALHHLPEDARATALAEMHRVLKPGGRALIVEFSQRQRMGAVHHAVALLHGRSHPPLLDEAAALMRATGFRDITMGPLGFGGLGYALAHQD
jgi:demethylmenaquinone methyltransferase/2-methoxy-6-polyprenyl-1,4-benzoquinol methylase/phosphoethanolamine N-methyltransferase